MSHSKPAPGNLELIRAFVNTRDIEAGTDVFTDAPSLRDWLAGHGLAAPGIRVARADVEAARDVRESLRAMLLANNGEPLDPGAPETLSGAAARARFSIAFDGPLRASMEPQAGGVAGALGRLLAIVARSMAEGTWQRFKACANDACEWAFYDAARNHSRKWCEMAVCGNRMKARAYREREREREHHA